MHTPGEREGKREIEESGIKGGEDWLSQRPFLRNSKSKIKDQDYEK